jgi:hypothetical protein
MNPLGFQLRRTGSLVGPVRPFLFLLVFLAASVGLGQKVTRAPVIDSILGVGIGSSLDQAHTKLDRLRKRKPLGTREEGEGEEEARQEQEQEREGGRKEAWVLRATSYATVALQVDREGQVVWITGFVRPGKEIPFAQLGDLSLAKVATNSRVVWNVVTPSGGYRVIAKGQNGKARVISILSLASSPIE